MRHEIIGVAAESIAYESGIEPGDVLLRINGAKIKDVLDYRFAVCAEELTLEIEKAAQPPLNRGEIWELEIEKDADEDLGIFFKHALMSAKRRCANNCVFCFVAQQPPGLRRSLYIRDDDIRLSFLHGNYVTLTNLSHAEIKRIASYHLSPLRISVHAADLNLRARMMNSKNAANLFDALEIFANAGIKMHFQIVLCKNINDGEFLSQTIAALAAQKGAESLAVVPAGITRHRENLFPLEPFTPADAKKILAQINAAPRKSFVFAADEWYIIAGEPLPPYDFYRDFPQLDNGVGMMRLFEREFFSGDEKFSGRCPRYICEANVLPHELFLEKKFDKKTDMKRIGIVTGFAAEAFMRGLAREFEKTHPHVRITVYAVKNNFFGENITVSGLLTCADIIAQLKGKTDAQILFLPQNAFRANTETMLDGTTRKNLAAALGVPVKIGSTHGGEFFKQLSEA
jgi:putative radical SAM enzyme (TIGR03279 family)